MTRKPDNWAAFEYASEIFAGIRSRLKAGAEGSGATFDANECELILAHLKEMKRPNSRPPRDFAMMEADIIPIARHCAELEKSLPLKNAVKDTAKHFGCSEMTVRNARKNALPRLTDRSFFPSK